MSDKREIHKAEDLLLDALYQACGEYDMECQGVFGVEGGKTAWQGHVFLGFNHGCISTWEEIEEYLYARGRIDKWMMTGTRY